MAIANTTLQIRKSGTPGVKPTSLANGELAINFADDKLYYKNSVGDISYFYGANNGPSFSVANANNTLILASTPNDTLSIVPGNNITISACTTSKTVTINGTGGDISPAYNQANAAFNQANTAFNQANSAFAEANIANDIAYTTALFANGAFREANSAAIFANGAFVQANNISAYANAQILITQGVDATQNTNIASAQLFANGAFLTANSAGIFANGAFDKANSAGVFANGAFDAANSAGSFANSAYTQANTTVGVDATQNTNIASAQSFANGAFTAANSAIANTVATQGVDATQNTIIASAQSFANSAFAAANNAVPAAGGTMTGTLYIDTSTGLSLNTTGPIIVGGDVTISGNLNISGTANTYNSETLNVADPMIYLASNNSGDAVDIGFIGHFVGTGSSGYSHYQHTGFVRDYHDRKWKLFSNVSTEPTTIVSFDANTIYDTLKVGTIEADSANINNLELYSYSTSAYAQANLSGSFANSAYTQANNISAYANAQIEITQGVDATQNTNIASAQLFANSAFLVANSASSNTIITQGVDTTQNTNISSAQSFANGAFVVANSAASFANGAFVTANSAALFANGAFSKANTSVQLTATTQTVTGNIIVSGSVTAALPPRVVTIADGTSVTINGDTTDIAIQTNTQSAGTLTINAPTGTPVDGQKIIFRLKSTNIQTFAWDGIFVGSYDLLLPSACTGSSKYDYMGFVYNSAASKWQFLAKNFGF
jgi:hypothetical protein